MSPGLPPPAENSTKLKVLIVEDSATDAEMNLAELDRAGFQFEWERAATERDFRAALQNKPELILSDYSMPGFDGLRALALLQESGLDIPFILISGTMGEDIAVTAMRQGAADYLLKDRLARLGSAVRSALAQTTLRREKKKAEDQLLRAQRLEAIGTLSVGIAHDLNNILAPTLMVTTMLRETLGDGRDAELLDVIEQSARRGANILQQLLTFTRGVSNHPALIQSRDLVDEMLAIMRETFPREIEIVDELPEELAPIFADSTQIHQVLMNLCVNARDAMPQGGKLTLSALNHRVTSEEAAANAPASPGPHVVFAVSDTGHGIPPDIIERIFEPFYTTKPVSEGTGLGLSTVAGIVRSHGGFITVESEVGTGSRFRIFLPATAAVERAPVLPAAKAGPVSRGERILLVDDERSIRFVSQRTLEKEGYSVMTATDGQEALKLIEDKTSRIDLVISDLMMPKLSGLALIKSLRSAGNKVKIVATTGLDTRFSQEELARVGVTEILPKPFSSADLLDTVRRQLAK